MLKETIYIEMPIEDVWNFVEMEFAKAFKTSPSKLLEKENVAETANFTGKSMTITQRITVQDRLNELVMESESGKDIVQTRYTFSKDDDNGTFLSVSEGGKGKKGGLRSLNFTLMSLPILRGNTKKRLRQRLESIKMLVEDKGEVSDDSSIESTEA